jgi:hypothetical protein
LDLPVTRLVILKREEELQGNTSGNFGSDKSQAACTDGYCARTYILHMCKTIAPLLVVLQDGALYLLQSLLYSSNTP